MSRRFAAVAGIAAAAIVALGAVHRSRNEWAARCDAESAARSEAEARVSEREREHAEACEALQRRMTLLENQLARERGLREISAEDELARANAKIAELETRVAAAHRESAQAEKLATLRRAVEQLEGFQECQASMTLEFRGANALTELVEVGTRIDAGAFRVGYLVADVQASGLNQGVNYVPPAEPVLEPQRLGEGLNQGVQYVDPPVEEQVIKQIGCKLLEVPQE